VSDQAALSTAIAGSLEAALTDVQPCMVALDVDFGAVDVLYCDVSDGDSAAPRLSTNGEQRRAKLRNRLVTAGPVESAVCSLVYP